MDQPRTLPVEAPSADRSRFAYPKSLSGLFAFCGVFFAGVTLLTLLLPWLDPPGAATMAFLLAVFLPMCGVSFYCQRVTRGWVEVDREGISSFTPRGRKTSLRWAEVERIRERSLAQRLELHGGGRVVKLENQLLNFDRLRSIVMRSIDWKRLLSTPVSPQPLEGAAVLPATFRLPAAPLALLVLGLAVPWVFVLLEPSLLGSFPLFLDMVLLAFVAFVISRAWLSVRVTPESIVLRNLWRIRTVLLREVQEVRLGNRNILFGSGSFPLVTLTLNDGTALVLTGMDQGSLAVYRSLLAARGESLAGARA